MSQQDTWDDWDSPNDTGSNNSSSQKEGLDSSLSWGEENSSNDDWDAWDSSTEPPQNTWNDYEDTTEQSQEQDGSWEDYPSGDVEAPKSYVDNDFNTTYNNNGITDSTPKKKFNLSYVGVALLICTVVVILIIIISKVADATSKPKNQGNQGYVNNQIQYTATPVPQSSGNTVVTNPNNDSAVLIRIPAETSLNYSGDVYETNGTVSSKNKYVMGHQVIYCITIKIAFGSSSETVQYFCNYASYNAVKTGDLLFIKYQQVDENYISINEITK